MASTFRNLETDKGSIAFSYGASSDVDGICALGRDVFYQSFATIMPTDDLLSYLATSYSHESIQTALEDPSTTFIVAKKDEQLVGFLQLARNMSEDCIDHIDSKMKVHRLYISTAFHGHGLGTRFLSLADEEAQKLEIKNLWLASWEQNPNAERLYARAGYERVGEMVFRLGSAPLKDWVMLKKIL